jgi:hypothetical protein
MAPHLVIPAGTKVIARPEGTVGIVVHTPADPAHSYRVRFPDGAGSSFHRRQLTIYRHEQSTIPGAPGPADLFRFVAFRCVVGSKAYGLAQEQSDVDRRGFYLPPAELH